MEATLLAVVLLACAAAQPMMVDQSEFVSELPSDPTIGDPPVTSATTETTSPPPLVNCTTARAAAGACVVRHFCDYGTNSIDRTLYAPRGYLKSCRDDEVCCPLDSIVQPSETVTPTAANNKDEGFQFDDDD